MSRGASLRIRCPTWDHVEVFYGAQLVQGRSLALRLPFAPTLGGTLTLALELPSHLVMAIDTRVVSAEPIQAQQWLVRLNMVGLSDELVERLKALVANGRDAKPLPSRELHRLSVEPIAVPSADDIENEESREAFSRLQTKLNRLRTSSAHGALEVKEGAEPAALRDAYLALLRKHHPNRVAMHDSLPLTLMAEEISIHLNRAYECVRRDARLEHGWILGFDQLLFDEDHTQHESALSAETLFVDLDTDAGQAVAIEELSGGGAPEVQGFVAEAGSALRSLEYRVAQDKLAEALKLDPKDRSVRALYHVALGHELAQSGKASEAITQYETALVHDAQCEAARKALGGVRGGLEPANAWKRGRK